MDRKEFEEKFEVCDETGAWLFKTTACMERWNVDRDYELNHDRSQLSNVEWNKEQRIWSFAHDIITRKHIRPKTEDLEEFVKAHLELKEI